MNKVIVAFVLSLSSLLAGCSSSPEVVWEPSGPNTSSFSEAKYACLRAVYGDIGPTARFAAIAQDAAEGEGSPYRRRFVECFARHGYVQFPRLHRAVFIGDVVEVSELLKSGVDVNRITQGNRATPAIHLAIQGRTPEHLEIMDLLIAAGSDLSIKDGDGDAPLIYAARTGWRDAVALLLEAEIDKSVEDSEGKTACDLSQEKRQDSILQLLGRCR